MSGAGWQPLLPPGSRVARIGMSGLTYQGHTQYRPITWMILPYGVSYLLLAAAVLLPLPSPTVTLLLRLAFGLLVLSLVGHLAAMLLSWRRNRGDATIDSAGLSIREQGEHRRVLWAECEAVRRKGRKIEVMQQGEWCLLPSPDRVEDARWLEVLITERIADCADDATAMPADVAAAFAAMREPERL